MSPRIKSNRSLILQVAVPLRALLNRLSFIILLVASIVIIVLGKADEGAMHKFRAVVVDGVTPVLEVLSSPVQAVVSLKQGAEGAIMVYKENQKLKVENQKLRRAEGNAQKLEVENARLRELVHFVPDLDVSYISARIVTNTSGPYTRAAIISAGSKNKVRKGNVVVNERGLVGRVTEVGNSSARVLLITDINSKIPVVTGISGVRGIAVGKNSDLIELKHLPLDSRVKVGEKIVTSGDGKFFPPGVSVGVVESATSKIVTVRPSVNWGHIGLVSVADYNISEE